jgi:hypothetical protein
MAIITLYAPMQIIVLGSHRSGTSLITRLINMMGAYFDAGTTSIGFNDENPKGFWERRDVIACNDALLASEKCSWENLANWELTPTPTKKKLTANADTITQMKNIVLELDAHRPWVMKDPRLCITFPYWKGLLEVPVAVVVYRDALEVATSLKTRNHFSLSHGIALWEYSMAGIANGVQGIPTIFVRHDEVISQPLETVKRVFTELEQFGVQGLRLPNDKEVLSFIEPTLYRSRLDGVDRDTVYTAHQRTLIDYTTGKQAIPSHTVTASMLAKETMEDALGHIKKEQKMAATNQNFAAIEQHRNELQGELGVAKHHISELERLVLTEKVRAAEYEKLIQDIRTSTSWKISHACASLVAKLTGRK